MIFNRDTTAEENEAENEAVIGMIAPELPVGSFQLCIHLTGFRLADGWHAEWQLSGHAGDPAPRGAGDG